MIKKTISIYKKTSPFFATINVENLVFKGNVSLDDEKILEKSSKKLKILNFGSSIDTTNYLIELFYKNEENIDCFKMCSFKGLLDKIQEVNEYTGKFSDLSKKELKVKNILKIEEEIVKKQFEKIIKEMTVPEDMKILFKNQIEKLDEVNHNAGYFEDFLPILYFDDNLNKKVWVVPNFYDKEDLIFDYETEIPLFLGSFQNYLINDNKSFVVMRKENIESFCFKKNNCYSYVINSFPEGFLLNNKESHLRNDNKYTNHYKSNLFEKKTVDDLEIYLPEISILNIEDSIKILKMVGSNLNIEEVKININKYINNNYYLHNKSEKISPIKYLKENQNNIFISNEFDFIQNKKTKTILNNLNLIKRYEPIPNKNLFIEKMEITFYKDIYLTSSTVNNMYRFNGSENYLLELDDGSDIILPKDKGIHIGDKLNNLRRIYKKDGYTLYEDNFLITKQNDLYNCYDLEENIETEENLINLGKGSSYFLLHNNNGNLFLINKTTREKKIIDNTKKIFEVFNIFKSKMDFNCSFGNFKVFITDNKMFYFDDFYNQDFPHTPYDYTKFNYEEFNKNELGHYIFNVKIPLLKKENSLKYSENIKKLEKNYYIKNNKLNLEIIKKDTKEIDEKYLITDVTFELDSEFISLNTNRKENYLNKYDMTEYLHSIKINGITLKNEEAKDFLTKTKFFDIKNTENTKNIEVINKDGEKQTKLLISKNNDLDFNLYNYVNNNIVRTELANLYKKGKVKGKKLMPRLKKIIYFTENKLFLLENDMSGIHSYDYSFKKSLENKDSFLNEYNSKRIIFCKNEEIIEIKLNEESSKIEKIINISNIKNHNKIINDIEISL